MLSFFYCKTAKVIVGVFPSKAGFIQWVRSVVIHPELISICNHIAYLESKYRPAKCSVTLTKAIILKLLFVYDVRGLVSFSYYSFSAAFYFLCFHQWWWLHFLILYFKDYSPQIKNLCSLFLKIKKKFYVEHWNKMI